MKNRDIYQRDPSKITLLNNGVATMTDALTDDERRTLRFELEHFVCEGEYQRGLVRILDSYVSNQGQPEQQAAWISGFFGSGKSHLAKMLRFLWTDYTFPEDGATARWAGTVAERCTGPAEGNFYPGQGGVTGCMLQQEPLAPAPGTAFGSHFSESCSSPPNSLRATPRRASVSG